MWVADHFGLGST